MFIAQMSSAFRPLTLNGGFLQFKIPTFNSLFYSKKPLSFSLGWCRNQYFCTNHWDFSL